MLRIARTLIDHVYCDHEKPIDRGATARENARLLKTGQSSDVLVRASSGKEYKLHRNIICHCPFFMIALNRGFLETNTGVTTPRRSTAQGPVATSKPADALRKTALAKLSFHVEVYAIGGLYLVPGLQNLAAKRYSETLNFGAACKLMRTWNDFTSSVKAIYDTTPEQDLVLRKVVVRWAHSNYAYHVEGTKDTEAFTRLLENVPEFEKDLDKKRRRFNRDRKWNMIWNLMWNTRSDRPITRTAGFG
ncbi:hypothetical protein K490DRAFT_62572 [Saccharata proteae CBS 121410]|uniref:BTB domain-containing protein n=1 Tax=Saccharata proteae CBS 121410 TaxID=1314787 RepID=A0A9P4I135_9PEZI|nr:hypothetical protein K490DRAFT_62572 [Saccharata proteae CBS 121410]